jgi:glycosyltransferase involved in cell wall biosynthesis
MLSILIPTYNTEIVDLVEDLYNQCRSLNIDYEIRCYDDGSSEKYKKINRSITEYKRVVYTEMDVNLGRAKIRNLLADDAIYEKLLFLDADSGIIRDDFIFTYIKQMTKSVIYGGRIYSDIPPDDKKKILHWKYGKEKESKSLKSRLDNPYLNFMSNNFIVSKQNFSKIHFDEFHQGYGYEDTLFAYDLKRQGMEIIHIDNPVLHLGIENTGIFLDKTEEAVRNLVSLYKQGKLKETKLIDSYEKIKGTGFDRLFSIMVLGLKKWIFKDLYSVNPHLNLLQMYKLALFIENIFENEEN